MTFSLYPEVICVCRDKDKELYAPVSKLCYVELSRSQELTTVVTSDGEFSFDPGAFLDIKNAMFPTISTVFYVLGIKDPVKLVCPSLFDLNSTFSMAPIVLGVIKNLIDLFHIDTPLISKAEEVSEQLNDIKLKNSVITSYYKGFWMYKDKQAKKTDIDSFPGFQLMPNSKFLVTYADPMYVIKLISNKNYEKCFWFLYSRATPLFSKMDSGAVLDLVGNMKNGVPSWFVGDYSLIAKPSGNNSVNIIFN
jgi:hypothetical protein